MDPARSGGLGPARPAPDRLRPDELWRGRLHLALTELQQVKELLDQADHKLDELTKDDAGVRLLETIPGVSPRTAEAVAAFLPRPELFHTTKQVSAYGGFVPRQYQSTDTDHRGRITKRGPKTLRKLLVECAWVMLRYNSWARTIYQRLTHGGKAHKKQAIVALARKLLGDAPRQGPMAGADGSSVTPLAGLKSSGYPNRVRQSRAGRRPGKDR